jgi:molecular chaperone GrpE
MKTQGHAMPEPREVSGGENPAAAQDTGVPSGAVVVPSPEPELSPAPPVAALQEELRVLNDRYLRLAADFDNFKKRTAQDGEIRAAAQKELFILEMLPALDSLDRALACDGSASREQLHQGVEMISLQLLQLLHRHDIKPDDCLGRPFDPHRHEAIGTAHDAAQPSHVVLKVSRRGWIRGKDVLRPAHVVVNDLTQAQPNDTSHSSPPKHDQKLKAQEDEVLQPGDSAPGDAV